MFPTFRRYLLPSSSGKKWVGCRSAYVCVYICSSWCDSSTGEDEAGVRCRRVGLKKTRMFCGTRGLVGSYVPAYCPYWPGSNPTPPSRVSLPASPAQPLLFPGMTWPMTILGIPCTRTYIYIYIYIYHVTWGPCPHSMARPRVADGGTASRYRG
jgi:hypothetical protein